jgi:PKD domain/Bacterial Ig-like domain
MSTRLAALTDGQYTLQARAVDAAGNVDATPASVSWVVDTVAPAPFSAEAPVDHAMSGSTQPTLSWDQAVDPGPGSGIDHLELIIDGDQNGADLAATQTQATPSSPLSEGAHIWLVRAIDKAGNSNQTIARSITIDTLSPDQVSLDGPHSGAQNLPDHPAFAWQATTDANGIEHYELWIDGARDRSVAPASCDAGSCSAAPSVRLDTGPHTWSIRAFDPAGNWSSSPTATLTVDAAAPSSFDLRAPVDEAHIASSKPSLSWSEAIDDGIGLDRYDIVLDGTTIGTAGPQSPTFTLTSPLPDGVHRWRIVALDGNGNSTSSTTRTFVVDSAPPAAEVDVSSALALTGREVTFDASRSTDAGGRITRFEWDLDGDGAFELTTTMPITTQTYNAPGTVAPSVRVVDEVGHEAIATRQIEVTPAPPDGPVGVSINDGAKYTNTPSIKISTVWEPFATTATVSNDGGFRAAHTLALSPDVPWRLDASGPERLPKTIYVRFDRPSPNATFQDDIILDQTRPRILAASAGSAPVGAVARASARRTISVRIRAHDKTSGVVAAQSPLAGPFQGAE